MFVVGRGSAFGSVAESDPTLGASDQTAMQQRPPLCRPAEIPNYEFICFIAHGGFGDVWLARERLTGVLRAVKLLCKGDPARAAREIEGVQQYQQCAHNHPNMLQILTVGETPQCLYYVMEAADPVGGESVDPSSSPPLATYVAMTLRGDMQRRQRLDPRSALDLVAKVVSGLARLHAQGLGHYDVKPENILIVQGEPKIGDVGLVGPVAQTAPCCGTPGYVPADGWADDVYAVGKILYELITGKPARAYPHLPKAMLAGESPALAAAIRVMNRACHRDRGKRTKSVDALLAELNAALRPRPPLARTILRGGAALAGVAAVGLLAGTFFLRGDRQTATPDALRGSDAQASSRAPRLLESLQVPCDLSLWRAPDQPRPRGSGPASSPYLWSDGAASAPDGLYTLDLPRASENFVLDYHLRFIRPWGGVDFVVLEAGDSPRSLWASFFGQPDGLGLRASLSAVVEPGVHEVAEPVLAHPQPGLEYLVRLARCRSSVQMAVWPLARASRRPILRSIDIPHVSFTAGRLGLTAQTQDPHSRAELLSVRLASYDAPLERADQVLPEQVDGNATPAWLPPLKNAVVRGDVDLLSGEFHPYDSDMWMSIGNWSWWSGVAPGSRPKPIKCIPFSTEQREKHRGADTYDGWQFLRFDGAAFRDFRAAVRIKLADPGDPKTKPHDPFVCSSHAGSVGLAFRMQDRPAPGHVWGGGYICGLTLDAEEDSQISVAVARFGGLVMTGGDQFAVGAVSAPDAEASVSGPCPRAAFFAPDGQIVRIEVIGPRFRLLLGDQPKPVLEWQDPAPEYYREGRMALFAGRLMASFDELHVTPLE